MSINYRDIARRSVFNKEYTKIESGDNGPVDYILIEEDSSDKLVDVGEEDVLIEPLKDEYLRYRNSIDWKTIEFDVVRKDGIPVEYIGCENPDVVENKNITLDHTLSDYFTNAQNESITLMENMELKNSLVVDSEFFDSRVLNNFAISSDMGMLCNDVGTGKTRVAVAIAFRDRYQQKNEVKIGTLPIRVFREVVEDTGDKQKFKMFFGSKSLKYKPFSEINVSKLGDELEKARRYKCLKSNLVVCSPSVFHQWCKEITDMEKMFPSGKKFLFISVDDDFTTPEPIDDPDYHEKVIKTKKNIEAINSDEYSMIVMTNNWYNQNLTRSSSFFSFNRIFYDEPDTIEYKSNQKVTSRFTWLISSTIREWIEKRYYTIKGTEELAGKERATRIGETEVSTYDDPSLMEVVLGNFFVRVNDEINSGNKEKINFIEYGDFCDNFYKAFGTVLSKYEDLCEALSAYDVGALDFILGTDKLCIMDKICNFVASKYADNTEIISLNLKFGEQKQYAESREEGDENSVKSQNFKKLTEEYEKKKTELYASIKSKDEAMIAIGNVLKEKVNNICVICNKSIPDYKTCHVTDCCFTIMHSTCLNNIINKPKEDTGAKSIRRRKKVDVETKEEVVGENIDNTTVTNNIFKGILYSCGKEVKPVLESGTPLDDAVMVGSKVNTSNLFDINRVVKAEEYKNVSDVYSEEDVPRTDCPCCGIIDTKVYNLSKSNVVTVLGNPSKKPRNVTRTRRSELLTLINNAGKDKRFLIYATNGSNVTRALTGIVPFNIVEGDAINRERVIDSYRKGEVPNLVLLNHENAAGLNLTETTDLVIFNQTSASIVEQVIGRVDRIGLKNNVNVHLFDTNGRMKIFILRKYKK